MRTKEKYHVMVRFLASVVFLSAFFISNQLSIGIVASSEKVGSLEAYGTGIWLGDLLVGIIPYVFLLFGALSLYRKVSMRGLILLGILGAMLFIALSLFRGHPALGIRVLGIWVTS